MDAILHEQAICKWTFIRSAWMLFSMQRPNANKFSPEVRGCWSPRTGNMHADKLLPEVHGCCSPCRGNFYMNIYLMYMDAVLQAEAICKWTLTRSAWMLFSMKRQYANELWPEVRGCCSPRRGNIQINLDQKCMDAVLHEEAIFKWT